MTSFFFIDFLQCNELHNLLPYPLLLLIISSSLSTIFRHIASHLLDANIGKFLRRSKVRAQCA